MKARLFVRVALILSLASWIGLFHVMLVASDVHDAMLYGKFSILVAIMCGAYKYYANDGLDPEASLTRTDIERQLATVALFLPPVLAMFSAFSLLWLHAPVAKVGWTIYVCSMRSGATCAEEVRYGEHGKK